MNFRTGMHLGSDAAAHGALDLERYVADDAPAVPATVGCQNAEGYQWGMLGNDDWGDCVPAAVFHCVEVFYLKRGLGPVPFGTPEATGLYTDITGFNPNAGPPGENPTDQGTDPSKAMAYWQAHGLPGHKIVGFGSLQGNSKNVRRAIWEFGAVLFGLGLPADCMNDVAQDGTCHWKGANHGKPEDGHCVVANAFTPELFQFVSWSKEGDLDNAYAGAYLEQIWVPLSKEQLNAADKGPGGFDFAQMRADLALK